MKNIRSNPRSESQRGTIVVFTGNHRGGILHFTMELGSTLSSLGYNVVVFVPDNSETIETYDLPVKVARFRKRKSLKRKSKFSNITAAAIEKLNPLLVLFADSTIISSQVLLSLQNRIATAVCIHDVVPHIAHFRLYDYLKKVIEKRNRGYSVEKTELVILLSENSYKQFSSLYPQHSNKAALMPLGAHVPKADQIRPPELDEFQVDCSYYLFFGRISKYKGIIRLLQAYKSVKDAKPMLVIAGSGGLQPEEKQLVANDKNILLINRYIDDGEMLYLINNSLVLILPYIEATQSGVLPIAYHFKVPVITSNVSGLVEFVKNGVTGIVFNDIEELTAALISIGDEEYRNRLGDEGYAFYKECLDWSSNLLRCIGPLIQRQNSQANFDNHL